MNDRLIKFARLVEAGSFTRAAALLHISQPALSISIDKLEREVGAPLLTRTNKKLELTDSGRAVYNAAMEHQNVADHMQSKLARIANKRPQVRIGMIDSIAGALCISQSFEQLESTADVTVAVNNSRFLREAIKQRQLDVAYLIDDGAEYPELSTTSVGREELLLVCHKDLVENATRKLSLGRLDHFICYDKPSTTYRHIQTALQSADIKPHITLLSTSPDLMLSMVLRGRGVAALPLQLVQEHLDSGNLTVLPVTITRPLCRIQLKGKTLEPVLDNFINQVPLQK
jgi:DNA-binding transcriptional LysR family regulator